MEELKAHFVKYVSPKAISTLIPVIFLSIFEFGLLATFILSVIAGDAVGGLLIFAIITGGIIYLFCSAGKKNKTKTAECLAEYEKKGMLDEVLADYGRGLSRTETSACVLGDKYLFIKHNGFIPYSNISKLLADTGAPDCYLKLIDSNQDSRIIMKFHALYDWGKICKIAEHIGNKNPSVIMDSKILKKLAKRTE